MDLIVILKYWLPVLMCAGLIFYLSSIPGPEIPKPTGLDLSPLHIIEFFTLSYLLFRALSVKSLDTRRIIILTILISSLYGVATEVNQIFVPGRDFDIFDVSLNFIGSNLILYKIMRRK